MGDPSNWQSTTQHYSNCIVQSNPINTNTEGARGFILHCKWVEFREYFPFSYRPKEKANCP